MATQTRARGEAPRRQRRRTQLLLVLAGAAVLGIAMLVGVLSAGESASRVTVGDVARTVEVDGEAFPRFDGDPLTDPIRGRPFPVVTGEDFDGSPVSLGDGDRPQLIAFMASWCPACQQELPELVEWHAGGAMADQVELIIVATNLDDTRPNWPPDAWLDEEGYNGPVMVDDAVSTVARTAGLNATPFWVALDRNGSVVLRLSGILGAQQLDELVEMVVAEGG